LIFPEEGHGCVSPDGKTIATVAGTVIKLWDFNEISVNSVNKNLRVFDTSRSYDHLIDISFDGQTLAIADYGAISLWKLNGTSLKTIETYGTRSISFSPSDQIIAIASADSVVKLYRTDDDSISPIQVFTGHTSVVGDVSFSPDGQFLASASMDNTVKLWSLDGSLLQTLEGHESYVNSVSFSPDGKTLASASSDGTIVLWNLNLDELLVLGCHLLKDFLKTNSKVSQEDRSICSNSQISLQLLS
jgi:WD40 repeat protein